MKPSSLETKFSLIWRAIQGLPLESECVLIPGRRWRVDFLHKASKTVIEIEGGIWMGKSRHTSGSGFTKDCEKYNELAFAGYEVFRLTQDQINVPYLTRIVNHLYAKTSQ